MVWDIKFENATLFGHDPQKGIVAVDFDGKKTALLFVRESDGRTRIESHEFQPYFWTSARTPDSIPLNGDHPLAALRKFEDWTTFQTARAVRSDIPIFALNDPLQQFLTVTGKTLFKGMTFDALRRLQIHLKISCLEGSSHANATRDSIAFLALADHTGWEETLEVEPGNFESECIVFEQLQAIIEERDPDIIEGHQLFKEILPFLIKRAQHFKTRLNWGRDGSPLTSRASRLQIAEKTIQYTRYNARGRHFVDTFLLTQYYDISTRELENFSLDSVTEHFGISEKNKAAATRALAGILSASYFTQAQIFPYNYQDVIVRGNATKIDALFLREYLRCLHSLPEPPKTRAFEGGYTDIFYTGVIHDVWHCDVASLYPSVILCFDILPKNDTLSIFRKLLTDLRSFRLEAKRGMRDAVDETTRQYLSALQNTFKILINSFYGYLGFAQGHFADFETAAAVTSKGRELLHRMVGWLNDKGAQVIEIDTDGIYFHPPEAITVESLDTEIRTILPKGIEVEFDTQYSAMFSYKTKNYALLGRDGQLIIKGAALKSRGMEPYLRDFLERIVRCLLEKNPANLHRLREEFETAIRTKIWPIERLARTESLQDNPSSYQKKIATASRNRSAAFELALASRRDYRAGDTITYYVTGTKKKVVAYEAARMISNWNPVQRDENVEYYVAKLNELSAKFEAFAPKWDIQTSLGI